jgi:multidrug resistance efflux pump
VHKGDLLMVIDPTNYSIAVGQAEAAVQQAQASVQNVDAQLAVQEAQDGSNGATRRAVADRVDPSADPVGHV